MRQNIRIKNTFVDEILDSEKLLVLVGQKEICLKINGKQSRKSRNGSVKLNNYSKQLAIPFKIYADLESVLRGVQKNDRSSNASYTEKYQEDILCSFAYKVVWIDDMFSKPVVLYKGEKKQSV